MKNKQGVEEIMVRFVGGPCESNAAVLTIDKVCKDSKWPPIKILVIHGHPEGHYNLMSHSNLPDSAADKPNIARGVVYQWVDGPFTKDS